MPKIRKKSVLTKLKQLHEKRKLSKTSKQQDSKSGLEQKQATKKKHAYGSSTLVCAKYGSVNIDTPLSIPKYEESVYKEAQNSGEEQRLSKSVPTLMKRPSGESIARLVARREKARLAHIKVLAQKRQYNHICHMTDEAIEKQRESRKIANMTEEQIEKQRKARKITNMTEERIMKQRKNRKIANMTEERIMKQRKARKTANMAEDLLEKQRKARRIANMTGEQITKQRKVRKIANMAKEKFEKQRKARKIENMTEKQIEKQRKARKVMNMTEEQIEKQRKGRKVMNMTKDQIKNQRMQHRTLNMTQERIKKQQLRRRIQNMTQEKIEKQHIKRRMPDMTADQIAKKRKAHRKHNVIKQSKQIYAGNIETGAYLTVEKLNIGKIDTECQYCGAVRFATTKGRAVNSCCHQGQVQIPPLSEYPVELKRLLTSEAKEAMRFRESIRAYNSCFAFATFGAQLEDYRRGGPPLVKIHGQVYHYATTSLSNMGNNPPRNGQIYIYDDVNEAVQMRLHLQNPVISREIEELLREINPYAIRYKMLRDMSINGDPYILQFVKYAFDDTRRYNLPTTSQLAAIIVSKDGCIPCADLKVYPKQDNGKETTILSQTSQHADPMTFPLLFPHGDLGWSYNMLSQKGKKISPVQYYGHRLALRPKELFSPLLHSGKLSQQYIINCYVLVERQRLDFVRHNQGSLRSECYQGLIDHVANSRLNDENNVRLGTVVILPATYIGSPRCMQQLYQDAMAICRKIGRPDFFITMTCNPKWPEIIQTLNQYFVKGTSVNDIPTIVTNIFKTKLNELINDLTVKQVLGPVVAHVYTIEFQKRGLPHAHMLVALRQDCKLLQPEHVDKFITAELSDNDSSLRYYQLRHMMHGLHIKGLLCWDETKKECSKGFPKYFTDVTDMTGDGFPTYRRRDNSDKLYAYHSKVNGSVAYVDNRMVVPHNPYLLKKYDCHINVEYCSSVMAIKYIHKYIHKGHDRARMGIKLDDKDEVTKYIDSRYVGPMEAAWRLNEIPLHDRSHSVVRLPVHLPGQQYVRFEEGKEEAVVSNERASITMLLAWFQLNKEDAAARSIMYGNIPESYAWNNSSKKWLRRKNNINVIGRIVNVSPKDSERFFLKLILNRFPGATSYKDLQTHGGVTYQTYREAAIAMGLTESCQEATAVLEEAATTLMPKQLRRFFVYYLIGDDPSDALQLWNRFQEQMLERGETTFEALYEIEELLNSENRCCKDFGLPEPSFYNQLSHKVDIEYHQKKTHEIKERFNFDQLKVYERIINCVSCDSSDHFCFFIDGPGGTGKTFLYNGLYHNLVTLKKKVACIAWTGIASILLPCGTTSHRFFNLPISLNEGVCLLKTRDKMRLHEIDVVIWDEASMIPRKALEMIDRTLRDLMINDLPFGGKFFILGGDFRQVLPVVKKGTRAQIVEDTIKSSYLWPRFEVHQLTVNMRAATEPNNFANWLLDVGNGHNPCLIINETSNFYCKDLIAWFFENVTNVCTDLLNRIILSPQNDEVNRINERILSKIPGDEVISYSIDKATLHGIDRSDEREEEATLRYPVEYLNSIMVPGLPPHRLKLKVGSIVMLIRNLSIADGLCNGSRLMVKKIGCRILTCQIVTGDRKDTIVDIPRIQLNTLSSSSQLPFVLYRRQFPVRLAYALTINKAQGQTFQRVGLYIERPIFSHGQLYVALSRCVSQDNIKVHIKHGNEIENIVFQEVL